MKLTLTLDLNEELSNSSIDAVIDDHLATDDNDHILDMLVELVHDNAEIIGNYYCRYRDQTSNQDKQYKLPVGISISQEGEVFEIKNNMILTEPDDDPREWNNDSDSQMNLTLN